MQCKALSHTEFDQPSSGGATDQDPTSSESRVHQPLKLLKS